MSDRYAIGQPGGTYFLTTTVVNWIDIFTRDRYRTIVLDSLSHCVQHKHLTLHAWVLMSNHLHWIASAPEDVNLSDVVRDFKKFTSYAIVQSILNDGGESRRDWMMNLFGFAGTRNTSNTRYQVWQNGSHAEALFSPKVFKQKLDYLHANPVRAGWVDRPEDYRYSSARDYLGEVGLLNIEPIILKEFV